MQAPAIKHLCLAALAGSAAAVQAEGARSLFDCTITAVCEAGTTCVDMQVALAFTLTPVALDALGGGAYTISYGDVTAEMTALRSAGPYVWYSDDRLLTLTPMLDGQVPVEMTLFSEDPAGLDPSTTTFLTCEATQ